MLTFNTVTRVASSIHYCSYYTVGNNAPGVPGAPTAGAGTRLINHGSRTSTLISAAGTYRILATDGNNVFATYSGKSLNQCSGLPSRYKLCTLN